MSTDAAGVLAAIDGAVRDWETSSDAMRWTPSRLPSLNQAQKETARRLCARTGVDGYAAMFMVLDAEPVSSPGAQIQAIGRAVASAFAPALAQVGAVCRTLGKAFGNLPVQRMAHDLDAGKNPRAHIRCAVCNPCANSGPVLGVKPSLPKGRRHSRKRKWR